MDGRWHVLFEDARLGDRYRRRCVFLEALRLDGLHWRRNVLLEVSLCGRKGLRLLDDQRRLRRWLLAARFLASWLVGTRLARPRLLLPALLRPLLLPLLRLAIAAIPVALAMTIASAAPLLFSLLRRLLARVG